MRKNYTTEERDLANNQCIIRYLQSAGHPLEREGSGYWRSKQHSSLVIRERDGYFNWNARGISGFKPVELAKQLLMNEGYGENQALVKAVHDLAGTGGVSFEPSRASRVAGQDTLRGATQNATQNAATKTEKEPLIIPEPAANNTRIINYLRNERGIDAGIISDCIDKGMIYQTKKYANAAFVSRCADGEIRHIFLRGTTKSKQNADEGADISKPKTFRMDSKGSDKSYPFVLQGKPNASTVYVFESAIDALSHATLCKLNGKNGSLASAHRISLHGTSFGALRTFLADNPEVTTIIPCLDADEAGVRRSKRMQEEFGGGGNGYGGGDSYDGNNNKRYTVKNHNPPRVGNDYNEMLLNCQEYGINKPHQQHEGQSANQSATQSNHPTHANEAAGVEA